MFICFQFCRKTKWWTSSFPKSLLSHFAESTSTFHCLLNYIHASVQIRILHTQLFPTQINKKSSRTWTKGYQWPNPKQGRKGKKEMRGKVKGEELGGMKRRWKPVFINIEHPLYTHSHLVAAFWPVSSLSVLVMHLFSFLKILTQRYFPIDF